MNVVSNTKYLGVIFDNKLEFKEPIKTLEKTVARAFGILTKLKYIFPNTTLLKLYFALIHPILLYNYLGWLVSHIHTKTSNIEKKKHFG